LFSLKQIFKKDPYSERIGNILFSKEVLPYFHETPPITNKTLYVVKRNIDDKMVMAYELGMLKMEDTILFLPQRVLTQDNIPIKAKDINLKCVQYNEQFTKENYQKGQIYLSKDKPRTHPLL